MSQITLLFNEEEHKYYLKERPSLSFTSVSKLIGLVKQPFDIEFWSKKKAEERGITQEEILQEWEDKKIQSQEKGTRYHLMREQKLLNSRSDSYPSLVCEETNQKKAIDLKTLKPGIYPELILYNLQHGIVGTADIVEIFEDGTFFIGDHKTNQELKFNSFKKFDPISKERRPVMMQPPLEHLEDCSGIHYTLQLSLYACMLEQFGYKCKGLTIYHAILNEDEELINEVEYPLNYRKKEAQTLMKWFKEKHSKQTS